MEDHQHQWRYGKCKCGAECGHPEPLDLEWREDRGRQVPRWRCRVCGTLDQASDRPVKTQRDWRDGGSGQGAGKVAPASPRSPYAGYAGTRPIHARRKLRGGKRRLRDGLPPRHGDVDVQHLLLTRQDRVTWRQWQVGTLMDHNLFLLSAPKAARVLGLSEDTVKEAHRAVCILGAELNEYERILRSRWSRKNSDDDWSRKLWNRWRPRNSPKQGRVEGPARPWGEAEFRALSEVARDVLEAYEDGGAAAGVAWKYKGGRDLEAQIEELPASGTSLIDGHVEEEQEVHATEEEQDGPDAVLESLLDQTEAS